MKLHRVPIIKAATSKQWSVKCLLKEGTKNWIDV